MTRLDQLARPIRKNGEHIKAIVERERRSAEEAEKLPLDGISRGTDKRKSRSMMHLNRKGRDEGRSRLSPLQKTDKNAEHTKSMTQLSASSRTGWTDFNFSVKMKKVNGKGYDMLKSKLTDILRLIVHSYNLFTLFNINFQTHNSSSFYLIHVTLLIVNFTYFV